MKTRILLFCLAITSFVANAQFSIQGEDGTVYEDGDMYITNSTVFAEGALDIILVGDNLDGTFYKAELVSATGNDGADFEICFGLCYTGVSVGQRFPNNGSTGFDLVNDFGDGNHLYHGSMNVDPDVVAEYTFRFFEVSEDGTTETGEEVTLIYRYDPDALGLEDLDTIGLSINATILTESMTVTSQDSFTMSLFDLSGRLVQTNDIVAGSQNIDVAGLSSQTYIARFTNDAGVSQTLKVIKK